MERNLELAGAESDLSEIQTLYPALKKGKTPPNSIFEIKLPPEKIEVFKNNFPALSKMPVKKRNTAFARRSLECLKKKV